MINVIDNINVALFIKKDNLKISFTKKILNIFECNEKEIEKILFEIEEIKKFRQNDEIDMFFDKNITINGKDKKLEFIVHKVKNFISIIVTDITNINHLCVISETLFSLNKLLSIKEEDELFQKIVKVILDSAEFSATFIMINKNNILEPIGWGNKLSSNLNCIKNIEIPLNKKSPALDTPVAQAFLTGKIVINDNSETNPDVKILKDEMLKKKYLSSVGLPIFKNNKPYGAICICHNESNYFSKFKELLKEISDIISYILSNIEESKFRNIIKEAIDISSEWIVITDKQGKILYVNDIVIEKSGYSIDKLIGNNLNIFLKDSKYYEIIEHKMKNLETYKDIINLKTFNNEKLFLLSKFFPYNDYIIYMGEDITNERQYKRLLNEVEHKDKLTGFLTRKVFFKEIKNIVTLSPNKQHLMMIADINNFSFFNIEYGKKIGDLLFTEIAKDINKMINQYKNNIIIARDSDSFLIFIEDFKDEQFIEVSKSIESFFNKSYIINDLKLIVDYNVGISVYKKDTDKVNTLLELAIIALKKSKFEGINNYRFYSNEFLTQIKKEKNTILLIEEALKNDEFVLFYQPHIDSQSKKLVGAESLLRIKKGNEIITPYYFIEQLEKSSYLQQLDMNILCKVEEIITKTNLRVSFNLSLDSFNNQKIIDKIIKIGQKYPDKLEVELLERTLINDSEYAIKLLHKFRENDILIAMDDFGTGYSSLSYLLHFPINILKIDISFVKHILKNKTSFEIVKATINLCKELNILTIAEGVETMEQYLMLKTLECSYIQGYYFYKPMDEEKFLELCKTQKEKNENSFN